MNFKIDKISYHTRGQWTEHNLPLPSELSTLDTYRRWTAEDIFLFDINFVQEEPKYYKRLAEISADNSSRLFRVKCNKVVSNLIQKSWIVRSHQVISGLWIPTNFAGPLHWFFWACRTVSNLKFAVKRITNIQSTVLISSEGTAVIHLAFK